MLYQLVYYGNDTLKKVAEEIENIDGELIELIDSMNEIMHKEKGIGLAAPQVDVSRRLIVIDLEEYKGDIKAIINPVVKEVSDATEPYDEGCLSVPGVTKEIIRPSEILVTGVSTDGKEIELEADGLFARVLQHEIDHLNGVLFIDYLEDYLRNELRPELKKIKKMNKKD
ncbi:MAG: peptide deformylase [bacterium]|nr:peptide deformylase [bacterium]